MKTELTEVKGIGEKTAEKLLQQGIESVEALIATAVEEVSLITGFGLNRAEALMNAAREFVGDEPEKSEAAAETPPNAKKKKKKKSNRSGKKKKKAKKGAEGKKKKKKKKKKKGGKNKRKKAKGKKKNKKRK